MFLTVPNLIVLKITSVLSKQTIED